MSFRHFMRFLSSAAFCILLSSLGVAAHAQVIRATTDLSLQIQPQDDAPEIFNVDIDELISPAAKTPQVAGYFAIEATQVNKKPLILWLKKDPAKYKNLAASVLQLTVEPKYRNEDAFLFTEPGKSSLDCPVGKTPSPCVTKIRRGEPLRFLNVKLVESVDPADRLVKWRLFYEVAYALKGKTGTPVLQKGWISSEDITTSEYQAEASPSPAPTATPEMKPQPKSDFDEVYSSLAEQMGNCVITAGKPIKLAQPNTYLDPAFSQTLLPYWKKKLTAPGAKPPVFRGVEVTSDQMVAIDTLARTIYGEMATCNLSTGPGYLMAVGRVVLNRVTEAQASDGKKNQFMCNPSTEKNACLKLADRTWVNDITQVLIKPYQFSTWNNERIVDLNRVLCPSGRKRLQLAQTQKLSGFDQIDRDNWEDSLRIAAEAVLDEPSFRQKTDEIKSTFYVSGSSGIPGYTRVTPYPKVMGQLLDKGRCIKFLRPMTKAEIKAAANAAAAKKAATAGKSAAPAKPAVKAAVKPVAPNKPVSKPANPKEAK